MDIRSRLIEVGKSCCCLSIPDVGLLRSKTRMRLSRRRPGRTGTRDLSGKKGGRLLRQAGRRAGVSTDERRGKMSGA